MSLTKLASAILLILDKQRNLEFVSKSKPIFVKISLLIIDRNPRIANLCFRLNPKFLAITTYDDFFKNIFSQKFLPVWNPLNSKCWFEF